MLANSSCLKRVFKVRTGILSLLRSTCTKLCDPFILIIVTLDLCTIASVGAGQVRDQILTLIQIKSRQFWTGLDLKKYIYIKMEIVMYNPMCIIMQGEIYLVFLFFFLNSGQATDLNLFVFKYTGRVKVCSFCNCVLNNVLVD